MVGRAVRVGVVVMGFPWVSVLVGVVQEDMLVPMQCLFLQTPQMQ
jgi:hypothetical protein